MVHRKKKQYRIEGTYGPNHTPFSGYGFGKNAQSVFKFYMKQYPDYHFESLRAYHIKTQWE